MSPFLWGAFITTAGGEVVCTIVSIVRAVLIVIGHSRKEAIAVLEVSEVNTTSGPKLITHSSLPVRPTRASWQFAIPRIIDIQYDV
jgi:hypothetical protein